MNNKIGIRDQIKNANSTSEIQAALEAGKKFEYASPKTVRAWKRAAEKTEKRFAQLLEDQQKAKQTEKQVNKKAKKGIKS